MRKFLLFSLQSASFPYYIVTPEFSSWPSLINLYKKVSAADSTNLTLKRKRLVREDLDEMKNCLFFLFFSVNTSLVIALGPFQFEVPAKFKSSTCRTEYQIQSIRVLHWAVLAGIHSAHPPDIWSCSKRPGLNIKTLASFPNSVVGARRMEKLNAIL